jgi:hypothetical protein
MYGLRQLLPLMPYMAHRNGFISQTLHDACMAAGFSKVTVKRLENYNLMAVAQK